MDGEKFTHSDNTIGEIVTPNIDISYLDISLKSTNVLYKLDLAENRAIQNFAISNSIIYTTQRNKDKVILAESYIMDSNIRQGGRVTVNNAGHGQTLEYISKGDFSGSLLISLNANKVGDEYWSKEIGIARLSQLKFSNENSECNYDSFKRFTDLEYANKNGISNGTSVIRADAALSTDQSTILIWTRDNGGFDTFTAYDFNVFCSQLNNSGSDVVSFKNNSAMKNACKFSFMGQVSRMVEVPKSFQGIELSNISGGLYSIYLVSGSEYSDDSKNTVNRIYRLNSNGVLKNAGKLLHSSFNPSVKYEIEGVKISGDNLLFGLTPGGTGADKTKPYIMKISKSFLS